jgi:hypothetical protein
MNALRQPRSSLKRAAIGSQGDRSPVGLSVAELNIAAVTILSTFDGSDPNAAPLDIHTFVAPRALGYNSARRIRDQLAGDPGRRYPLKPVIRSLSVEGT